MLTNNTKNNSIEDLIQIGATILKNSGCIAFPTDTVYGLGCLIDRDEAIKEIYRIKGRSFDKPLAAHISKIEQLEMLTDELPSLFFKLADAFLPGPLSIIVEKKQSISDIMTSNLKTIGIRFPDDAICLKLIDAAEIPLAATSANLSGYQSPVSGIEVKQQLEGLLPLIIDNGLTKFRQESTIISLVGNKPKLLREGALDIKDIESVIGVSLA